MNYWQKRLIRAQQAITSKNIKQTQKQLRKYYSNTMRKVIDDFEATYEKLLRTVGEGNKPTPADLYKLDKYWQMQGQMKRELQKLGDKEAKKLSEVFETHFFEIYYSIDIPDNKPYNTIDRAGALQLINQIWCADGKSFSQRIWDNVNNLIDTLNENLIHCVVSGKKTTELKKLLQERFNVSYNRADAIVRTEMANIQTQAAKQRYEDYGLKQYRFLADADERTCSVCGKMDGKKYYYSEMQVGVNAPPMHPRDRCCIIPVVE